MSVRLYAHCRGPSKMKSQYLLWGCGKWDEIRTGHLLDGEYAVAQFVEAPRCKPEGPGFDSRWCHWNFSIDNPSGRTMALGLTQPLTDMSTRNISWEVKAAGA